MDVPQLRTDLYLCAYSWQEHAKQLRGRGSSASVQADARAEGLQEAYAIVSQHALDGRSPNATERRASGEPAPVVSQHAPHPFFSLSPEQETLSAEDQATLIRAREILGRPV